MKILLLWKNIKLVLCIKRSYKGQNGPLKGYKIHYTLANERHISHTLIEILMSQIEKFNYEVRIRLLWMQKKLQM